MQSEEQFSDAAKVAISCPIVELPKVPVIYWTHKCKGKPHTEGITHVDPTKHMRSLHVIHALLASNDRRNLSEVEAVDLMHYRNGLTKNDYKHHKERVAHTINTSET